VDTNLPEPKHDHASLIFPEGFLWGAGTSSFQVEGNNFDSEWWYWEQVNVAVSMRSGLACNQYQLFDEDFKLAKELEHNSHRLSIEWSRIEPKNGEFNLVEIDHYKKVLKSLKDKGFTVMLTLWHFSNPEWFAEAGGWTSSSAPKYFARFVEKIAPELSEYVDFWVTINEPGVYTFMAYLGGDDSGPFPPAHKSKMLAAKATWNMARGHKKVYKILKKYKKPIGIAQNVQSFEADHEHSIREGLAVILSDLVVNHLFYFLTKGYHDFLGLNYYFNYRYDIKHGFIPEMVNAEKEKRDVSDLGWEVYPEGIFDVLTDLSDGIPIYITECGLASTNDDRRTRFLLNYLQEVYRAIAAGANIKGFFYWSLIDNFEWKRGFEPRFGLIEVDYTTQKRIVRPSALVYKEIIKRNAIPHDLLKLLGHGIAVEDVLKGKIRD
jgi:beta-glucosidase